MYLHTQLSVLRPALFALNFLEVSSVALALDALLDVSVCLLERVPSKLRLHHWLHRVYRGYS